MRLYKNLSNECSMSKVLTIQDVLKLETFDSFLGSQFDIFDGKFLAFSKQRGSDAAHKYGAHFLASGERGRLFLIDLETRELRHIEAPAGLGLFSPLWSPDGQWVAMAATGGSFMRPCVLDVKSGKFRLLTERNLALDGEHPLQWISDHEFACRLLPQGEVPIYLDIEYRGPAEAMMTWPKAWAGDVPTSSVLARPSSLGTEPEGNLCIIDLKGGDVRFFEGEADVPEGLGAFAKRAEANSPSICQAKDERLPIHSEEVASHLASGQKIYLSRDDDGTRLWQATKDRVNLLLEIDTHLAEVKSGSFRTFEFERPGGAKALVRCILPPDYREGETRPAVMWVYPGTDVTPTIPSYQRMNCPGFFNLQLLAAQGYVVIVPAIPVDEKTRAGRDIVECLAEAVLPALEAVCSAGLIDREHVHVFGQSMGGWAALALLAETSVFRSGIAMASISNLISAHGQFDVRFRYGDKPNAYLNSSQMVEECWYLPGPPWQHVERYVRNSPLFAVDRISAPVLMFHGDQDPVQMAQAEEMFNALRKAGKEVEFVRYWGEGHILSSPANIQDAWKRILAWLKACELSRNS